MKTLLSFRHTAAAGFTLVELLVVVGILILVTASSLLVLDHKDDQERFKKTEHGYKELRTALFGPDMTTTIGGELVISGFLADTGSLPSGLPELLLKPVTIRSWGPVATPQQISRNPALLGVRLNHGWRGPYLKPGDSPLSDPWGNTWYFKHPSASNALELGSLGRDGLVDDSLRKVEQYEKDYPAPMIVESTHYDLGLVPLPRRSISKLSATPKDVILGVLHAGILLSDNAGPPGSPPVHRSIVMVNGSPVRLTLNATQSSAKGDDEDDEEDDEDDGEGSSKTPTLRLDQFSYPLRYARQLQLVLYEANGTGATLADRVYAVDEMVVTYLPNVSNAGVQATNINGGSATWTTP